MRDSQAVRNQKPTATSSKASPALATAGKSPYSLETTVCDTDRAILDAHGTVMRCCASVSRTMKLLPL